MLLQPFESILNRNIKQSATARALCERLNGKVFAVHVTGVPVRIYFVAGEGRLSLASKHEGSADATISGTPLSLFGMMGARPEAAIRGGAVRIEGDAEIAQAFRDLLAHARPEAEEELSRIIGDVAAHQLSRMGQSLFEFSRRAANTFAQNIGEFLQEEGRDVPSRPEISEFFDEVDRLRNDVERTEARLALLERRRVH
jgi:ubiquinone biosynthesis protein UbiJ